jgi:hypothetical protein
MPIYAYHCGDCGDRDQRVAGLDDGTARCVQGGGLMRRLDEDIFQPYFQGVAEPIGPEAKSKASLSGALGGAPWLTAVGESAG